MTVNHTMMRTGLYAGALLLLAATPAMAQLPGMLGDRPDLTESTRTLPGGMVQIEAGYTFQRYGDLDVHRIGEPLLRFGLIDGLELRAQVPSYYSTSFDGAVVDTEESGFGDAGVAIKLGLLEQGLGEGIPSVSLLLGSTIPTGEDAFGADGWEPEARLAFGWDFTRRLNLTGNVGYAQRDPGIGDRYDEWGAGVALGFPLTQRLGGFAEYVAVRPDFDFDTDAFDRDYIDGGITYMLAPGFQLDAKIGVGVDSPAEDDLFVGAGLVKRF